MPFLFQTGSNLAVERQRNRGLRSWIVEQFVRRRMNTPAGYTVLVALALLVAGLVGSGGWQMASVLIATVIFIPLLMAAFFEVRLGLYLILLVSMVVPLLKRLDPTLPFTLLVDLTLMGMAFGVFIQQIYPRNWSFVRHPVVLATSVWLSYCLFQLVNPSQDSFVAWLYAVRGTAVYWLLIPIALFAFQNEQQVKRWVYFTVALSVAGALYGLYQEWAGFWNFELSWLYSNPGIFEQVSYQGELRTFSIFHDPGAFGLTMAAAGLLAMALALERRQSAILRVIWWLSAILLSVGLLLSGTRTAFVILPLGYLIFMLFTWRREVFLLGLGLALVWITLMIVPLQNPALKRLQSSFNPQQAISFQDRMDNQDFVQPYIQRHPIGNGLGSTGETGQIFSPHTLLSQFPPNSGFVQTAVETGWIGLLLYCATVLTILWYSVRTTFAMPKFSSSRFLASVLTAMLLALVVANYPQRALLAFPTNLIFPIAVGAIIQLGRFNKTSSD